MKKYSWKTNFFYNKADANKVGEELEIIERNGELTKENLVDYAERHKDSELYKCFEWDDKEASRKYRLTQANQVLCSITLEISEEPKIKQRVYVNIKSSDTEEKVFKNIKDVLENDEEYQQLIDKAKKDFDSCKEKYQTLINKQDLKDIIFEIYRQV